MRWKFVVSLLFAVASLNVYALGTNRAAGTPVVQPKNPVNNETCLACHQTINKLHNRGAHKNVNCGSCHTVPAEHMSAPGPLLILLMKAVLNAILRNIKILWIQNITMLGLEREGIIHMLS